MKFVTMSPAKLPARAAFGREPIFADADVANALIAVKKGDAISDGQPYDTAAHARNRAGVLRQRMMKRDPRIALSSTAIHSEDADNWHWWIVAKASPPTQKEVTTITKETRTT